MSVVLYRKQDYEKLRSRLQRAGELFTDPEFPSDASSLFLSGEYHHKVEWKRPKELCSNPKLVVDGLKPSDLNQGALGNCWFVTACASLCIDRKKFDKVFPNLEDQEWDSRQPEKYTGLFRFRFWVLGKIYEVVIDDLLPTISNHLLYCKSKAKNEFWSALLEKAYAKLYGCYELLAGGHTADALVDFTGGVSNIIDISEHREDEEKKEELFKKLLRGFELGSLMGCSIPATGSDVEAVLDCGLVKGHAYAITAIQNIKLSSDLMSIFKKEKQKLIKMRNPWGRGEWNGAWSDGSDEWKKVSDSKKKELQITVEDDGEFWMSYDDWLSQFHDVSLVYLVNTKFFSLAKRWHCYDFNGEWKGTSAGGCVNYPDTFLNNPQYLFQLSQEKHVMVNLQQSNQRQTVLLATRRGKKPDESSSKNRCIGFHIMKCEPNRKYRMHAVHQKAGSITFTNHRSVAGEFTLPAGSYVIVPSTFTVGEEGHFFLRLFSEAAMETRFLEKDVPTGGFLRYLTCGLIKPNAVVTVEVEHGTDFKKHDLFGSADPYCKVKMGRYKGRTHVCKDTLNPVWNSTIILYGRNPAGKTVTVKVFDKDLLFDDFMGKVEFQVPRINETQRFVLPLMSRGCCVRPTQGEISLLVKCSSDMQSV